MWAVQNPTQDDAAERPAASRPLPLIVAGTGLGMALGALAALAILVGLAGGFALAFVPGTAPPPASGLTIAGAANGAVVGTFVVGYAVTITATIGLAAGALVGAVAAAATVAGSELARALAAGRRLRLLVAACACALGTAAALVVLFRGLLDVWPTAAIVAVITGGLGAVAVDLDLRRPRPAPRPAAPLQPLLVVGSVLLCSAFAVAVATVIVTAAAAFGPVTAPLHAVASSSATIAQLGAVVAAGLAAVGALALVGRRLATRLAPGVDAGPVPLRSRPQAVPAVRIAGPVVVLVALAVAVLVGVTPAPVSTPPALPPLAGGPPAPAQPSPTQPSPLPSPGWAAPPETEAPDPTSPLTAAQLAAGADAVVSATIQAAGPAAMTATVQGTTPGTVAAQACDAGGTRYQFSAAFQSDDPQSVYDSIVAAWKAAGYGSAGASLGAQYYGSTDPQAPVHQLSIYGDSANNENVTITTLCSAP
jgi:hypothetical protein